jgi:hypothetical protein
MGIHTAQALTGGSSVSAEQLDSLLDGVVTSLGTAKDYFCLNMRHLADMTGHTAEIEDCAVVPYAATLVAVGAIATSWVRVAADATLDIYKRAGANAGTSATVCTTPITFNAGYTSGTANTTAALDATKTTFAAGDRVELVATVAATETLTAVTGQLWFKKASAISHTIYPQSNDSAAHSVALFNQLTKLKATLDATYDYQTISLEKAAKTVWASGGVPNTTVQATVCVPYACTLDSVKVVALVVGKTGGDPTIDVFNQTSGETVLSAPITYATALYTGTGAVSAAAIAAGDTLTLRYVLAADADCYLTGVKVTLGMKKIFAPAMTAPVMSGSELLSPESLKSQMDTLQTTLSAAQDYAYVTMETVASTSGDTDASIQARTVVPYAGTIAAVYVTAGTVTTTGGAPTVDVWNQTGTPASVLSAAITMATANTAVGGTVSVPTVAANDILTLRFTVGATAALAMTKVTLAIKKALAT